MSELYVPSYERFLILPPEISEIQQKRSAELASPIKYTIVDDNVFECNGIEYVLNSKIGTNISITLAYMNCFLHHLVIAGDERVSKMTLASEMNSNYDSARSIEMLYRRLVNSNNDTLATITKSGFLYLKPNFVLIDARDETIKKSRSIKPKSRAVTNHNNYSSPNLDFDPVDWMSKAACKGIKNFSVISKPNIKDVVARESKLKAEVCKSCPVILQCDEYAESSGSSGFWAGSYRQELTRRQRASRDKVNDRKTELGM